MQFSLHLCVLYIPLIKIVYTADLLLFYNTVQIKENLPVIHIWSSGHILVFCVLGKALHLFSWNRTLSLCNV